MMTLSDRELDRMEYLLGKSRLDKLFPNEENELRDLILKEQPSAKDNSLDELIKIGLILVGMYLLAKLLDEDG